ncbi:MAG TPA: hypothetical protein VFV34_20550 [Blastocatellia bacterium]|nr:hypothetical protein [Blastocatellia bacterium]
MRHRSLFWTVGGLAGLMVIGVTLGVTRADRTREPLQRINLAEPTAVSVVIEARGANHLAGNRAVSLINESRPFATGDFNGDGINDIAVGAPDEGEQTGAVFILFGRRSGSQPAPVVPDVRIAGEVAGDEFGFSLASADVNLDGIVDLLIGAPGASSSSQQKCGAVFTMLGSASLEGSIEFATLRGRSLSLFGSESGDRFGSSIASESTQGRKSRSINQTTSILVGAPKASGRGSVYYFSGISQTVDLSAGDSATATVVGEVDSALGLTVAFADVNADGTTDLVAGAPLLSGAAGAQLGAVYGIYRGADMKASYSISEGEADFAVYGRSTGDHFGAALAVGDVTGDGQADLLIGAPDANYLGREDAGAVYVLSAGVTRAAIYGAAAGDHLGASVAAGRSNSDTILDVIAGAPGAAFRRGTVSILYGGETLGTAVELDLQENADQVRITGRDDSGSFGWVVGSSVTMGRSHVVVSAPFAGSDSGQLYLIPQANAAPVTKVNAPNGGETVQIGNTFNITWTATDADGNNTIARIDVKMSTDGGASFPFVIAQNLAGNATNFQWQVNLPFTSVSAKIRVIATDDQDATGQDDSDNAFNIIDNGVPVTLTTPNGGEQFSFGQSAVVAWSVSALNQSRVAGFDLFYSTDSGANFTSLIASGISPGSLQYFWQVPPLCANKVRVLVICTTLTGARTSDSSNADFSIFNPGPTIDTGNMLLNLELGRMQFRTTPTAAGFENLFLPGCLVELSTDEAGTEFVTFEKPPAIKKGGRKLVTKGSINGEDIAKFFPLGAIKVLKVTNPACGITQMTIRRFGDQFFAQQ